MADFESIIKKHVNEEGNIPGSAIETIVSAIKTTVGNEFVSKEQYKKRIVEIDNLKEQVQTAEDNVTAAEKWKKKYEEEAGKFEEYKNEQTAKATREAKSKAYNELLKEVGIAKKWQARVIKGVSLDELELDDEGKFKDADKLKDSIKAEWGDCIVSEETKGADTATPPAKNGREGGKAPSRAAQIAQQYHDDLYGRLKED